MTCCSMAAAMSDNRGVTYADGKIFVGRLDGNLSAVDAKTGEELWTTQVVDYKQGSVITSPPLVVEEHGDHRLRRRRVRRPRQPAGLRSSTPASRCGRPGPCPGRASPGTRHGRATAGSTAAAPLWLIGSYDPKTNTVFWGTSNPSPWNAAVRSTGTSDYGKLRNLYTASTLAIDPDTGKIKWYLQSDAGGRLGLRRRQRSRAGRPEDRRPGRAGDDEGGPQRLLLCGQPGDREDHLGREVRAGDLGREGRRCDRQARRGPGKARQDRAIRRKASART